MGPKGLKGPNGPKGPKGPKQYSWETMTERRQMSLTTKSWNANCTRRAILEYRRVLCDAQLLCLGPNPSLSHFMAVKKKDRSKELHW